MEHHLSNPEASRQYQPAPLHGLPSMPRIAIPRMEASHEGMLEEYSRIYRRHRKLIMLCAGIGLLLNLLLQLPSLPLYSTRTSLEIRSLNNDFLDMRSVQATGSNGADNDTNLQTQIKLLQSDTLVRQASERLLTEPHPQSILEEDVLSTMMRAVHMGGHQTLPYSSLVADAAKRVKVKPMGLTRLVEITCESYDPKFSAKFCSMLTRTFEENDLENRTNEAQKTSEWLTKQLADVREKVEESQKKLEAAVGGNGLMLSQTTTSSGEERLRSLQDELTKAQADRIQQEALSAVAHSADPATVPEVQDNPEHRAYELKLADLRSQLALLVPALTEQNPKVVRLRSQIADAEAGILRTQNSSAGRQNNEYSSARHREALLQAAYNAQHAIVSADLQKAAQVSLLRRDVDSEQQLYQTLLQRAKEAGFASAMQATTIRVVDPASVPTVASSPQRKLAGLGGLALGSLVGVGLAFYRERTNKIFRLPGDVPRFLNVQELGVIPSTKRPRPMNPSNALATTSAVQEDAIALTRWGDTFSLTAEAYRNVTFSILLADTTKRSRSYVVSSPTAGEGKTTVTSNLGVALSKSRLRVVLIDGDLRRPSLHRPFALRNGKGLRNILRGEIDLENANTEEIATASHLPNISVVTAGEGAEDVVELLHSPYFGALLARLSRDFDVVLIDTPPILHMADARVLAGQSDGAILVLRAGSTTHDTAADARDLLDHDGVRLVGTILNGFDPTLESGPNYYSSYFRYQQGNVAKGAGV